MRIGIIDYNAGNLQSVRNAVKRLGRDARMVARPEDFDGIDLVLLPGQGAFGGSVAALRERGLFDPVQEWLQAEKPYLGICLGLQLLFPESEESPGVVGLSRFQGAVRKFREGTVKIPQIGWNSFPFANPADPVWDGLPDLPYAYFVHSFYCSSPDESIVASRTDYAGENFISGVRAKRLLAVQFHPEKSQDTGLALMGNFFRLIEAGGE